MESQSTTYLFLCRSGKWAWNQMENVVWNFSPTWNDTPSQSMSADFLQMVCFDWYHFLWLKIKYFLYQRFIKIQNVFSSDIERKCCTLYKKWCDIKFNSQLLVNVIDIIFMHSLMTLSPQFVLNFMFCLFLFIGEYLATAGDGNV